MTGKQGLWYLVEGLLDKKYDMKSFCIEFSRIYDLELDYDELNETEHKEFKELSTMAARFSDNDEELKIPKIYVSELEIREKAETVMKLRQMK